MSASHGVDTGIIKIMSGAPKVGSTSKSQYPEPAIRAENTEKRGKKIPARFQQLYSFHQYYISYQYFILTERYNYVFHRISKI